MAILVSHNNPIAPATAPSADELLNAYQAHAASIRGEAQQETTGNGYNPYAPTEDTQQDAQQAHISNMEQFLSPVPMNQYDINSEGASPEQHKAFAAHLEHDPAFKEFGEDFISKLQVLKQALDSGQIDLQTARGIVSSYGSQVIDPILEKHHHSESPTHKVGLHDTEHAALLSGGVK